MSTREHVFGSSYYPPHHEEVDWARDLDRMHAAGQRVIRTAELLASWDRLEVARHTYDWSWLDRVFDLAEERGMRILLGTGSQNPPIWMIEEYPDLPVRAADGVPYPTGAMWSWACKEHPAYLTEVERHVRTLAARYGRRPGLYGWQLDNEPGFPFLPWRGEKVDLFDYHPHTEEAFRGWLRDRYGTPEALSDAWRWDPTHHRYSSWAQVRAPRTTPLGWSGVTAWLDWRDFTCERLAQFLGRQAGILRALTPDLPVSTNCNVGSRADFFGVQMGQDPWRIAREVDAIGFDLYPGIGKRFRTDPSWTPMHLAYARGCAAAAGVELWYPEIESGPLNSWSLGPDHATTPADITRICTDVLGAGSRVTLYQGWREWDCIPIHWGALVDLHGVPTPRHDAAAAVAAAVESEADLFAVASPAAPQVGILVDHVNAVCQHGMGASEFYYDCLTGAFRALHGYPAVFLGPAELHDCTLPFLVVPFGILVSDGTGAALTAYVERGGHLLTGAKVGMLDGRGWYHRTRPGAGLSELLGVTEIDIDTVGEPVAIDVDGGTVLGAHHRQRLAVHDAEVIGRFPDGSAALTRRVLPGGGVAWACGTHLDLGVTRHPGGGAASVLARAVAGSGARRLWTASPAADGLPRVWAQHRVDPATGRGIVAVTSTDPEPRDVRLHVPAASARDLYGGTVRVDGEDLVITLPPDASALIVTT